VKRARATQALLSLLVLAGIPASPKLAESSTSEGGAPAVMAQQPSPSTGSQSSAGSSGATGQQGGTVASQPPPAVEDTISAAESDAPARRLVKFNEYEGPLGSIRVGFGLLFDYAAFKQDEPSKEQFTLDDRWKYRDGRVLFTGRLGFKRPTTWSAGIMYDADKKQWFMRQTGIMVAVPEIWGHIFVGRSKEGFSLNKVMVGYAGWGMERTQMNDATVPILADGIKWLGYVPKAHILWTLGFYGDALSEGQGFSSYENQVSGRFAWAPLLSPDGGNLLHFGISQRYGKVNSGKLRLRARPGAWAAPYFIDTGEFAADSTKLTGLEAYWRPGSWTFGTEYFIQNVDAPDSGHPMFHGGEWFVSWLMTGEVRMYNTRGGYFNQVSPKRPVFSGGPGAWEVVTIFGTSDLHGGTLTGGKYWRLTPMVNWYMSDHLRLEFAYGYGSLNRFGLIGQDALLPEPYSDAARISTNPRAAGLKVVYRKPAIR
jgi:phosphate-selective porin OprO and OprP